MLQIGDGLIQAPDCKALRHRAGAKTAYLRKDEPHPVRTLAAVGKFAPHLVHGGLLRIDEALQVVGIGGVVDWVRHDFSTGDSRLRLLHMATAPDERR